MRSKTVGRHYRVAGLAASHELFFKGAAKLRHKTSNALSGVMATESVHFLPMLTGNKLFLEKLFCFLDDPFEVLKNINCVIGGSSGSGQIFFNLIQ